MKQVAWRDLVSIVTQNLGRGFSKYRLGPIPTDAVHETQAFRASKNFPILLSFGHECPVTT